VRVVFGLMPVRAHLFAGWAVDAVRLMFGAGSKPWVAVGRALLKQHALQVPEGDTWATFSVRQATPVAGVGWQGTAAATTFYG
jgi:hypothetical protein